MVPAKFRQCRRPHQSQSPRSRRHRTRCHRRGRLQITMYKSNLSRQLILRKLPPTKSTVSLILTDSGNSPDVMNMCQNRWIVFPTYLINDIYDMLMFILLTVRL